MSVRPILLPSRVMSGSGQRLVAFLLEMLFIIINRRWIDHSAVRAVRGFNEFYEKPINI